MVTLVFLINGHYIVKNICFLFIIRFNALVILWGRGMKKNLIQRDCFKYILLIKLNLIVIYILACL